MVLYGIPREMLSTARRKIVEKILENLGFLLLGFSPSDPRSLLKNGLEAV